MEKVLEVDVTVITFIMGSIIPLVVGMLTKLKASSAVKAVVNVGLSVVTGVCSVLIAHDGKLTWQTLVSGVFTTLFSSGFTYSHVWKPTGVVEKVQQIAPDSGVGKPVESVETVEEKLAPGGATLLRGGTVPDEITQAVPSPATPATPVPLSPAIARAMAEADQSLLVEEHGMLVYLVPVKVHTEVPE